MKGIIALSVVLLSASVNVQAATWLIVDVLDGSSGFGASSFHDSSGADPMVGPSLAEIDEVPGVYGTYDDVTGVLSASGLTVASGGSFTLDGTLLFPGGLLSPASTVDVDFTSTIPALTDTTIGFQTGYVCCGGTGEDPNSFVANIDGKVMSLWGANFTGTFDGTTYPGSTTGMDIRLQLAPVPVPAAAWLFGSALLGLVGVARRRSV